MVEVTLVFQTPHGLNGFIPQRPGEHAIIGPDKETVRGLRGEGGSGAAPQALMDHMALSISEALPRVVDALIETGLRPRIRVIAAGRLVTSARAAWAYFQGEQPYANSPLKIGRAHV